MKRVAFFAFVMLYASGAAALDADAREVFSDSRYRFCHEEKYPLFPEERAWCPLVGEQSSACPALPAACRANVAPEPDEFSFSPSRGDKRSEPSPDDERRAAKKKESWSLPSGMSAIAQLLFWGLVIGGVLALIWVIIKNSMRGKDAA